MPTFPLLALASAANIAPDTQNRCWVPPHHLPRVQMAPDTGGLSRKALLPQDMLDPFAEGEARCMDRGSMRVLVIEQGATPPEHVLGNRR